MNFKDIKISSLTLGQWVKIADAHLNALIGQHSGHLYISFDEETIIENPNNNFSLLTFKKIKQIIHQKKTFAEVDDKDLAAAKVLLKKVDVVKEKCISSSLQIFLQQAYAGAKQIIEKNVRREEEKHALPILHVDRRLIDEEGNFISIEIKDILALITPTIISIKQSELGTRGVFTLIAPCLTTLMIKIVSKEEIAKHIIADKFLRQFGFVVPEYCALNTQCNLGKALCEKLKLLPKKARNIRKPAELEQLLQQFSYILVMKKLDATPFKHLHTKDVEEIFIKNINKYPHIFINLGPCCINNFRRLREGALI